MLAARNGHSPTAAPGTPRGRAAVTVGLAIGGGTGEELAAVFGDVVSRLCAVHGGAVELITCPRRFGTYGALAHEGLSATAAARLAERDAEEYGEWLRSAYRLGVPAIFRTAFNAQSLYLAREALWGVKPEAFVHAAGELLVVRDESQGFYSGRNSDPAGAPDRIERTCAFTRERTHRVLDFARAEAEARWGAPDAGDRLVVAYKFHLLDRRFEEWVREYASAHDLTVELYQPDTANRHFAKGVFRGRVVLVGANEWADVMHTELIARFGLGNQEERCSRNVYLADDVAGLEEYQTVHGSADDIAGEGRVNPVGTLRAAAALLERHAGFAGASERMESALGSVAGAGVATPDTGGTATTEEVAAAVLERYAGGVPGSSSHASARRRGEALVVVDLQRDFCAPDGHFARRGIVDPVASGAMADQVARAVERARDAGVEVVFVRTEVDPDRSPPVVAERNRREGRAGYLLPGLEGASFFGVEPLPGERVFTKAGYDPFLDTALEAHLRRTGVETLTLGGAFADVCVDATARSAYQKGFRVRVLADCTSALERPTDEVLAFMARFYGAEIATSEGWLGATSLAR